MTGDVTAYRPLRRGGRGRGGNARGRQQSRPYPIGSFILAYLAALGATITASITMFGSGIIVYLLAGFLLTRFITRRVVWWDQADNVENVAGAKLGMFLKWPFVVPVFLFKIIVARVF